EIKEMSFDGEAIHEGDLPPGGMARVGPVSGLEENCSHQADFNDLANHAVDFNPIADPDTVPAHQHKPAEKRDDEILQRHSQAGPGQPQNGRKLAGHADDHEDNQQQAQRLDGKFKHDPQGMQTLAFGGEFRKEAINQPVGQVNEQQDQQNPERRLDYSVDRSP